MKCLICEYENEDKKGFATHLQIAHKMKSEQYSILYLCDSFRPLCPICQKETRYVSFAFKKYCKEHSFRAEQEAGRIGGKIKKSWNKGKTKNDDPRLMEYSKNYTGEGNPFYGKTHDNKIVEQIKCNNRIPKEEYEKRLKEREDEFLFLTPYEEYLSRVQNIKVKCLKCGLEDVRTLQTLERGSKCYSCHPHFSKEQEEIEKYIKDKNIEIIKNDRRIMSPYEIDVYISSLKLGIEYNGLYWHSESKIGRDYHFLKSKVARERDLKLFHIFSDEWRDKREIVESMLDYQLNLVQNKVPARRCEVKQIDNGEGYEFFKENHISSYTKSKNTFALKLNGDIVCCLSLREPFQKKKYKNTIEIARFASKKNTLVIGGFSKLLKRVKLWCLENNYERILSYADLRFGSGGVYSKNGFQLIGEVKDNYWYTNGKERYPRQKFKAKNGISEKDIAIQNGVFKIYGCGSNIYEMTIS